MRLGNIDVVSLKLFSNEYWNETEMLGDNGLIVVLI